MVNFFFGFPIWSIGIGYDSNEKKKTTGPSGIIKQAPPTDG